MIRFLLCDCLSIITHLIFSVYLSVTYPDSDEETFEGEWYLDTLVTKSRFRRKGIGKELMQAAYRKAEKTGIPVVGLNVDQDNPKARKLYKRQGLKKQEKSY